MGTNLLVTAIVIVYLLFMLWIGWYSSTKITSNTDFMVAGRRLGPFLMERWPQLRSAAEVLWVLFKMVCQVLV